VGKLPAIFKGGIMSKKSPSKKKADAKRKALGAKHEAMEARDFKPTGKSKYAVKAKRRDKSGKVSANSPFKSQ